MKKLKHLIVKLGNTPGPHSKPRSRQTSYQLTNLRIPGSPPTAKMAEEEDYSSIPLPDRFTHKVHAQNARLALSAQ